MSDAPNTTTNSGVLCSPPPPPSLTPSIKINNQDQSECDRSEAAMYSVTMITTAPHVVEATAPAPAPAAFGETNTTASTSTSLAPPGKDLLNTPRPSIASTIMASYENDRYTALIREIIRSDSLISGERSSSNSFNSNRSTRSNLTPITNELNATGHLHCLRNLQAGSSDDHHHHHDDDYAIDVEMAQAMQRLLAMQHINEARQCGVLSTPGGKVCRDRRYYWDKVRDHSHRAKRFVKLVFTLHQSCCCC